MKKGSATTVFTTALWNRCVTRHTLFGATLLATCVCILATSPAQQPVIPSLDANAAPPPAKHGKHAQPAKPSVPQVTPDISIPVTPLGFAAPSTWYLGNRWSQLSLNFLDEDTLLFTFRIPGLITRSSTAVEPESSTKEPDRHASDERQIRALVLSLPSGKISSEAVWKLHDYGPYIWTLKDKRFLLRDQNMVQVGDRSLHLEPFLRFPGPVSYLQLDPEQSLLVANSSEPPAPDSKPDSNTDSKDETQSTPDNASSGQLTLDGAPATQSLLRIFRMDNHKVMLFSRVDGIKHLPLDGEGYYETLRGNDNYWLLSFQYFRGASLPLLQVESTCSPALEAMAPGVVLVSGCSSSGGRRLIAVARDRDKDRRLLWDVSLPPNNVWPLLTTSSDGLRMARATLDVTHPIGPTSPLDREDVRGQKVQVYDLATGKLQLTGPASPALDGGGNFALSPSGQRFAVLNAGAIQIYNLPAAPALSPPAASGPGNPSTANKTP